MEHYTRSKRKKIYFGGRYGFFRRMIGLEWDYCRCPEMLNYISGDCRDITLVFRCQVICGDWVGVIYGEVRPQECWLQCGMSSYLLSWHWKSPWVWRGVVWCGVVGVVNKSPGLGGGHTSPATPWPTPPHPTTDQRPRGVTQTWIMASRTRPQDNAPA